MSYLLDKNYMQAYSMFQGSPDSTYGKKLFDRQFEDQGDTTSRTRKEINYHYLNNTDIGIMVRGRVSGVVGSTIKIQSGAKKKKVQNSYEDLLEEFLEAQNFDITGRWHGDDAWRQIETEIALRNGVIVRYHYNVIWKIPFRVEIIGIDKIDTSKTIYEEKVLNGIKKDRYGRVIGLYLFDDETATYGSASTSTLHNMKNMDYFIEGWVSLSQYTAVSRFVTVLQTIDGISQYQDAEVQAAIDRSKNGIFWHTEIYGKMQELIADITKKISLPVDQMKALRDIATQMAQSQNGIGIAGVTPTPQDDKMTVVENKSASVFKTLKDSSEKSMAASLGGSQVSSFKDVEKGNFSSIKMASALDERELKIFFNNLSNRIIRPILVRLFNVGVQIGRIKISTDKYFLNPRKHRKFDIYRTASSVMSEKDQATADAKNLESGLDLLPLLYQKREGRDYLKDIERVTKVQIEEEEIKQKLWKKSSATRPLEEQPKKEVKIKQEEVEEIIEDKENEK